VNRSHEGNGPDRVAATRRTTCRGSAGIGRVPAASPAAPADNWRPTSQTPVQRRERWHPVDWDPAGDPAAHGIMSLVAVPPAAARWLASGINTVGACDRRQPDGTWRRTACTAAVRRLDRRRMGVHPSEQSARACSSLRAEAPGGWVSRTRLLTRAKQVPAGAIAWDPAKRGKACGMC